MLFLLERRVATALLLLHPTPVAYAIWVLMCWLVVSESASPQVARRTRKHTVRRGFYMVLHFEDRASSFPMKGINSEFRSIAPLRHFSCLCSRSSKSAMDLRSSLVGSSASPCRRVASTTRYIVLATRYGHSLLRDKGTASQSKRLPHTTSMPSPISAIMGLSRWCSSFSLTAPQGFHRLALAPFSNFAMLLSHLSPSLTGSSSK